MSFECLSTFFQNRVGVRPFELGCPFVPSDCLLAGNGTVFAFASRCTVSCIVAPAVHDNKTKWRVVAFKECYTFSPTGDV